VDKSQTLSSHLIKFTKRPKKGGIPRISPMRRKYLHRPKLGNPARAVHASCDMVRACSKNSLVEHGFKARRPSDPALWLGMTSPDHFFQSSSSERVESSTMMAPILFWLLTNFPIYHHTSFGLDRHPCSVHPRRMCFLPLLFSCYILGLGYCGIGLKRYPIRITSYRQVTLPWALKILPV